MSQRQLTGQLRLTKDEGEHLPAQFSEGKRKEDKDRSNKNCRRRRDECEKKGEYIINERKQTKKKVLKKGLEGLRKIFNVGKLTLHTKYITKKMRQ